MKKIIAIIFVTLLVVGCHESKAQTKRYSEYTIHQLESMTFEQWWRVFKQYAKEQGERVSETDRKYYELNYYRKFYLPDEAFDEEYE